MVASEVGKQVDGFLLVSTYLKSNFHKARPANGNHAKEKCQIKNIFKFS